MKVFVLGGTGAIGGHAVPALVEAGHEVTALARSTTKAAALERHGAATVIGSIFDVEVLRDALPGHDVVVNMASSLPSSAQFPFRRAWRENNRVRVDGSANVVDAAVAAGVPRLVQESVSMLYPDRGDEWIDETTPPVEWPMSVGNLGAEASAARFAAQGGDAVVLRFGFFIGPGARHSEEFFALARWRISFAMGSPNSYLSSIHLDDAASAVVAALDAPPDTYNVVDDEPLTTRDYATALSAAARKKSLVRAPGRLALLLGDRAASLTRSLRVSNARLRGRTSWSPQYPSAREAWEATAAVLQQRR